MLPFSACEQGVFRQLKASDLPSHWYIGGRHQRMEGAMMLFDGNQNGSLGGKGSRRVDDTRRHVTVLSGNLPHQTFCLRDLAL